MSYSGMFIAFDMHMKDLYSTIYSKDICRVAVNLLFIRNPCVHELNIRGHCNNKISVNSKYNFKTVLFRADDFTCLRFE